MRANKSYTQEFERRLKDIKVYVEPLVKREIPIVANSNEEGATRKKNGASERFSVRSVSVSDYDLFIEERVAIVLQDAPETPEDLLTELIKIDCMDKPQLVSNACWEQILSNIDMFSKNEYKLLKDFANYGFSVFDIFGCCIKNPESVFFKMGLCLLLKRDSIITDVQYKKVTIKTKSGSIQCFNGCSQITETLSDLKNFKI